MELTHASFFSGVGGLDLGLERAGWRTVSFSEIDPYASAVLEERWPGVPNLGDILAEPDPPAATLWSGGFPCQDLSVAGKRRGFGLRHPQRRGDAAGGDAGGDRQDASGDQRAADAALTRSGLAFAFLDLVARHLPPVILLENVPGLLSSHGGRDMAALLGAMADLGYGVAYRVLDARHFGVPQRRRRVFIVGLRSGPDDPDGRVAALRAAEVLAVGTRCGRHPPTGIEAWEEPAAGAGVGAVLAREGKGVGFNYPDDHLVGTPPDPSGVRAADGLARRLDDREQVEGAEVEMLPPGLDSHRYRCCGNGVVSNVAEWIGRRLIEVLDA